MILDRLAYWWIDWRHERWVRRTPEIKKAVDDLGLRRFEICDGRYETTFVTEAAAFIANEMAQLLTEAGAENYVEFDMLPKLERKLPPVRVTIQWANGESPAAQNERLRKEIAELKKVNVELEVP